MREGVSAISVVTRKDLMDCCGLSEEAVRVLEEAGGTNERDVQYQEIMGLAAAMRQIGFTMEEIYAYFHDQSREERRAVLVERRWQVVKEIHERQIQLGKIDYLLHLERR